MKTPLTYGAMMAVASAVMTLLLYVAGLHDSPDKLGAAQTIAVIGGLTIGTACLALAMREKRANFPATAEWGYGPALGAGVLTGLVASLLGIITAYFYFVIINPGFGDVALQAEVAKLEAKNIPPAAIAQAEGVIKFMMRPGVLLAVQAIGGFISATVLSLIIAIFFRRRTVAAPPPITPA